MYIIWDNHNKIAVSKPYACVKRARRRADKLDLAYGAYRYRVKQL